MMDDLEALLSEAVAHKSEADRLKVLTRKVYGKNSTDTALREEVQQLEARMNWVPVADVVCYRQCICPRCGVSQRFFEAFLQEQQARNGKALRIVSVGLAYENLPKKTILHEQESLCPSCLTAMGYPVEGETKCKTMSPVSPIHHALEQVNSECSAEQKSEQLLQELESLGSQSDSSSAN